MRLALRLLRPAPNQNLKNPRLWQDPVLGYFETHGKTEFLPGEQYNMTDDEKKAVLWRYRVKEILKKEYLRREYDPHNFKYKVGQVIDPSIFRWYAADMYAAEYFRYTPRSVFLFIGGIIFTFYGLFRLVMTDQDRTTTSQNEELLWWDRQGGRRTYVCGSGAIIHPNAAAFGFDF